MCGICGIVGNRDQNVAAERVRRMMQAMAHRGPDGEGIVSGPGCSFGMRRLSIIDLPGGQQPICNESGTIAVIFNGEIYNYREVRRVLEREGHVFSTDSDTETLVHGYESWGNDCVRHLRGMFAFAVMEFPNGEMNPARRVFLARDRMGIKPLYYARTGGSFLFASEVRALLAADCLPRELSADAISNYLLFGSICEPLTLIEGIRSLPPGYRGYVSLDAPFAFEPEPYWKLSDVMCPSETRAASVRESVRAALEDAVRHHLLADVPVGIFLSGGLDSTALAAIATKQCGSVRTLTVSFSEQEFSEAALARATANRLGTDHSELLLQGEDLRLRLDEALASFDQPSVDGFNTYFISWAAHQAGLKVALSGLGSDEIFGGYSTFRTTARISKLIAFGGILPEALRKAVARVAQAGALRMAQPDRLRKAASALVQPDDFPHPYFFARTVFTPQAVHRLLRTSSDLWKISACSQWLSNAVAEAVQLDPFTAVSWLESRSYLTNMLLRDTDALSMAHSLEVRVPFLDDPLLEIVLSCPQAVKAKSIRKVLLIESVGALLPEEIIRQPKRTFTFPWKAWLRGPLRDRVDRSLSNCDACLASVINIDEVVKTWHDFLAGRTSWSRPWSIFVLNEWVSRHLGNASSRSVSESKATAPALF